MDKEYVVYSQPFLDQVLGREEADRYREHLGKLAKKCLKFNKEQLSLFKNLGDPVSFD